ncbi:unnamed protein product [Caenorhabditis auriculariae]|uniref:C2 domain-containing protein n=1 Tax=Caenorhabditis auriculariae TaxID=2777116 RepID=A0A8S1GSZ4_9PELO|nr:unnamed protein product [Caenorhabditis auriculariae]
MGLKDKLGIALLKRKLKKKGSSSGGESDGDETDGKPSTASTTSGDETASSSNPLKRIFRSKKDSESGTSKDETNISPDEDVLGDNEEETFVVAKDANFGMKKYTDTDKPATWNVLVRVIEARDVDSGALRVRAVVDGRQKATRTVTQVTPKWKQNLLFTEKNISLEKLASQMLTLKLTRATRLGETVLGRFSCHLSAIIHTSDRSIIGKWVALSEPTDDEEHDDVIYETCGFLKVSICIYRIDESPPNLIDNDGSEEIWSGAQIVSYTLKIRLFRLCHVSDQVVDLVRETNKKKKRKDQYNFFVSVRCGDQVTETTAEPLLSLIDDDVLTDDVTFEQELYLPIQWPTVISKITFDLFLKRGRKRRYIGQAIIPLRSIYEPGEAGFLPTFGPSFLNFFGLEAFSKVKWRAKGRQVDTEDAGSKYLARLLVAVDCVEYMGESTARSFLDHSSLLQAAEFEKNQARYVLNCSLQFCNMINPLFASDNVQFMVSVGDFGSTGAEKRENSSSALGAMPNYDGCKYFTMPWGNMRPMIEVLCLFEDVEDRIRRANALMKMTYMLDATASTIQGLGEGSGDRAASLYREALDDLERIVERVYDHQNPSSFTTHLDENLQLVRRKILDKLKSEITEVRYDVAFHHTNVFAKVLRMLTRMRQTVSELAQDVQISLPSITVKMISNKKLIGYVKIPVQEVFSAERDAFSGQWCGRVRAIKLNWPASFDRKHRREQFPAVLHLKMWFGCRSRTVKWQEAIEPAEPKSFVEVFQSERKTKIARQWKPAPKPYLDEDSEDVGHLIAGISGYKFVGNWILQNTHDMWMAQTSGRPTIDDKALEVEIRNSDKKLGEWAFYKYTEYFGSELTAAQMSQAQSGWEYTSKWMVDPHRNVGGKDGWVYSVTGKFWDPSKAVDREERPEHKYRRRFIRRTRRATAYATDHEDIEKFQQSLGDTKWEYAPKKNYAYHDLEKSSDSLRRRRLLVEVELDRKAEQLDLVASRRLQRLYEAHLLTTKWQLRCYIMWAKDLLPIVKNSSHAFVRIFFCHHAKQTLIVENSQNPIWNETIVFESILIPGSIREIMTYPPVIHVEVRGERSNDTEVNLGRFEVSPHVITSSSDPRSSPQWYPLRFHKNHTRGSVLACFELFQAGKNDDVPSMPRSKKSTKSSGRFDIPADLRPDFSKYTVQFLCWGVRNLGRYQLLSVCRPFVEVTIGECELSLEPLKNVNKDPNFPEPMISFPEVSLPTALDFSPPLVVSLYDKRAFNRRPLIGVCLISDFSKYIRKQISKKENETAHNWDEYDENMAQDDKYESSIRRCRSLRQEGMPNLDWWSKYYASMGQVQRAPGYEECGMEYLRVLKGSLEEEGCYNHFGDFLDTFTFVRSTKGDFDDPEEKEKMGELKARLLIMRNDTKEEHEVFDPPGVEFVGPVECLVRVYVIEAEGLVATRKSGICDPYLVVRCGKQKKNMKKNYRADTTDPVFGEMIEMKVTVPVEKDLVISVMDKRRLLADEELGKTKIDLENRLLTRWRATAGLSRQYTVHGDLPWRDQLTPLMTLQRYCIRMLLSPPKVLHRKIKNAKEQEETERGLSVLGVEFWHSDVVASLEREEKELVENQRCAAGKEEGSEEEEKLEKSARAYAENEEERKLQNWEVIEMERSGQKKDKGQMTQKTLEFARHQNRRNVMGSQLQTVALYVLHQMDLVPEHVETRVLQASMSGASQCGKLKLFVDLFPLSFGPVPPPLDISPRQPEKYQLRVAILNVSNAIPVKRSFGDPVGDLYVKVFVNGMLKSEKTDVHYRSLDGCGEFNWRILLNIDYNPWEKKVVAKTKTRFFRKAREDLVDPLIIIQLWDKNRFKKDKLLGEIELDLTRFMEGINEPEDIGIFAKKDRKRWCGKCCSRRNCLVKCCTCLFTCTVMSCAALCCCCCYKRKKKKEVKPFPKPPKYVVAPEDVGYLSMFETQSIWGWWPMLTSKSPGTDAVGAKKKDDDLEEDQQYVMGLVEMEMMLVTSEEAKVDPVGRKRKKPNHSPYLEAPHRSAWNAFWFTSRVRPCARWFWKKFGCALLVWVLIILLIFFFIYAIFTNWPLIVLQIFK